MNGRTAGPMHNTDLIIININKIKKQEGVLAGCLERLNGSGYWAKACIVMYLFFPNPGSIAAGFLAAIY